jgi:peptidylprolyl isomerase
MMHALFTTSEGNFKVRLFDEHAPNTVANFTGLAEGTKEFTDPKTGQRTKRPFYDGLVFHRVIDGFMAQTGDPKGNGTGGSGVKLPAEFSKQPFVRGTVGMARSQDPNSGDSQFFIVFAPARFLDGQYTVWGQVVEGMEYVDKIKRGDERRNGEVVNPDRIIRMQLATDVNK